VFHIIPSSVLCPHNPREIPRELFIHDGSNRLGPEAPKKKGRPTKREKVKRAKDALGDLNQWLEKEAPPGTSKSTIANEPILTSHPPKTTFLQYQSQKSHLLNSIVPSHPDDAPATNVALEQANRYVLERLVKMDKEIVDKSLAVTRDEGYRMGIERVERAIREMDDPIVSCRGGVLGLLDGAGIP
jgi:hypothetical protein